MNIAKHMEAIFLAVVAVIGATTFATAAPRGVAPAAAAAPAVAAAGDTAIPVVVVSARRLSAAEKAGLPH